MQPPGPSYEVGGGGLREGAGAFCPWPPPPQIILIGTVHSDPRGYDRAWRLLDCLRPNLIAVEISRFSLHYRRRHLHRWQRLLNLALAELPLGAGSHLTIQRLAAQVAVPFEVRAARDWSQRYGVAWRPLDLGAPARRHLPRYATELLRPANLRALLDCPDEPLAEFVAREYQKARLAYARGPWRLPGAGGREVLVRERHLARRLQRLGARYRRVVHLGGWEHLVPWQDLSGLWHALAELQPLRLLLDEADALSCGPSGPPQAGG